MERRTPWLGYLCVILSAVIFGCMPLGANFLYAQGVTPMSLVFLRNLLSLPVLALLCQKQGGLRISRGALLETSLTGFFGCCITPILLFSSYRYLASGMATVFHFAYPVIVVLGGLGNIWGSLVAAAALTILPEALRQFADFRMLIYAIVLIFVMLATNNPQAKAFFQKLLPHRRASAEKED